MTNFILVLEIIGTIAFAISGAMVGIEKRLDLLGVILCGLFTAVGGGALRDIFMGNLPPVMFRKHIYVITALAACLVTFCIARWLKDSYLKNVDYIDKVNNVFDAIGLGVFTVGGMEVAMLQGYGDNAFFVIFLGVITGCGGGVIRDVTVNKIPMVFSERIYAIASLAGALVYYLLYVTIGIGEVVSVIAGMLTVFVLRMLASKFDWNLPKAF